MNASPLPNGDELLLLPEVARALRCSVKTVRRLIQEARLKAGKNRGRVVVLKSALLSYAKKITSTN